MLEKPSIRTSSRHWIWVGVVIVLGAVLYLVLVSGVAAQAASSVSAAPYTAQQAHDGARAYDVACAACHGPTLEGSENGPALVGPEFARNWGGRPAAELILYVRDHMPQVLPGMLNDRTYVRLTAYLMERNGAAAGEIPLEVRASGVVLVPPAR